MSRSSVTSSTVPSRVGTVAGHVLSRSAPSDADFGGPSLDLSTEARSAPTVKVNRVIGRVPGRRLYRNHVISATMSSSRRPASQTLSGFAGASLMRILRSVLARTSARVPVFTQSRSGRRSRLTLVVQILLEPL